MSWKKNAFSYLIWILYTIITGTALVSLGSMVCVEGGFDARWGVGAAALYLGIVGGFVFLFHRFSCRRQVPVEKKNVGLLVAEAALLVIFLAAGLTFRLYGIGELDNSSEYFRMAEVVAGQQIPQMVHGAVYFYVQVLHAVFLLFGNQYMAGIGLQILLQIAAGVVLYFVVRRLTGAAAALAAFAFCMCSPYMVQSAMVLSPDMLYLLLFSFATLLALVALTRKLRLAGFFVIGILGAFCCYIDIAGLLLCILGIALAFAVREEETSIGRRLAAAGLCVFGTVAGFAAFIGADSFMSGKNFWRVAEAWFELYRPEAFRLPITAGVLDSNWEGFALFGVMAFGIYGFWRDRKREYTLPYIVSVCMVIPACCYGIFTEEMPGFLMLYLLLAILAGVSLEQSFRRVRPAEAVPGTGEEKVPLEADSVSNRMPISAKIVEQKREDNLEEQTEKKVRYLDNPLPLPKKHVKRVLDYSIKVSADDDFDHSVGEDDDFDI